MSTKYNENLNPGVIFLSLLLAVISGTSLLSYFYAIAGYGRFSNEQQVVIDSLPWTEIGLTFFVNITVFIAAILLYLHRKQSFYFFLGSFVAGFMRMGWAAFHEGSFKRIFSSESIGEAVVLSILLIICVHVWRLERSGVLH
ncbi:hypothetical conserved protein [Candidatus Nitrosoglobus terrae]|uniref:Hypothetical conserved protein n=1 Tax=Candidatus Nitrosoglobus terrae TaxID=1630141 RepID=A0A1Q2SP62_9GAMM|nr:hypothetical protein [Candidatus Nitrosoglobus terrae]BAW80887.1 hypothetical conserved protein [Candidatus Nitrosoglobus terrae]